MSNGSYPLGNLTLNDVVIGSVVVVKRSGAPSASVSSPAPKETVSGTKEIKWNSSNVSGNLLLEYSSNEGAKSWNTIAQVPANQGSYNWDTSGLPNGDRYVIKVSNNGNTLIYSGVFTVNNPLPIPEVNILSPKSGDVWNGRKKIRWEAKDSKNNQIKINIYISAYGEENWSTIANGEENDGVYEWNTAQMPDGIYKIKVVANNGISAAEAISDKIKIIQNLPEYWGKE